VSVFVVRIQFCFSSFKKFHSLSLIVFALLLLDYYAARLAYVSRFVPDTAVCLKR
jgi:hypothetical protein